MKQTDSKLQCRMRYGSLPTARFLMPGNEPLFTLRNLWEVSFEVLPSYADVFVMTELGVDFLKPNWRYWIRDFKLSIQRAALGKTKYFHGFGLLFVNTSFLPLIMLRWEYLDIEGFVFDLWKKAGDAWPMITPSDYIGHSRV